MAIDYSSELNKSQSEAVLYTDGDCMVIAGAGSGKTRVLTYRIAHLLEMGIEPWAILALTFTNKAAGEMKQRIASQVGGHKANSLWMGTFHSIFSRILRNEAELLGFTHNFTIYDQSDSQNLIKSIIREMQLDEKVYKPNVVQNRISNAKNRLVTPSAYLQNAEIYKDDQYKRIPMAGQIYQRYCNRCHQADAMDFDDLLFNTFILFQQHPEIQEKYGKQFRHILVDEYQDTNYAQHCIVWQLTRFGSKVCVVGDDAQSIYSFRGANIDNMLKFTKLYSDAKVFKLERNYRSSQVIVAAANSLIGKNRLQIQKNVYSENEDGEMISVFKAHSDIEESEIVANKLIDLHTFKDVDWNGVAVLYRTNAQSRSIEEALRKRGLPYKIYGSLSFYQRKEIKDLISYFRLAVNPNDEEAFKRIINYPARGIGQTTVSKVVDTAVAANVSLWTVINDLDHFDIDINSGTAKKLSDFASMMQSYIDASDKDSAYKVASRIIEDCGILRDVSADHTPEGESRKENVQELMSGIFDFCKGKEEEGSLQIHLSDYLSEVSLLTDQDNETEDDINKVTLMTVHAAKGLEFDTVFIVGLEENLFPSSMCVDDERQVEEERRLFYVAMTRAKHHLFLLYATSRFRYGSVEQSEKSRFIRDIDHKYLNMPEERTLEKFQLRQSSASRPIFGNENSKPAFKPSDYSETRSFEKKQIPESKPIQTYQPRNLTKVTSQMLYSNPTSVFGVNNGGVKEGSIIEHERFGIGQVLSVEGSGDSCKARIKFVNVGEKTLLMKFARFKVLK